MIEAAKRPLLLIGAAANRKLTCRALRRFIAQTGIPFFTTQMGKGVVDETDPLFLGNAALSSGDFVHRAIDAADLIINVGHDVVEKPPFFMTPGGVAVIHINFTSAEVDPVYFPQVEVVGDIAHSVWQLGNEIRTQDDWDFSRFFAGPRRGRGAHRPVPGRRPLPDLPHRLVADVQRLMPDDGHPDARQRHLQDLVRPQLQGPAAQHGAAGQRAGDDGRGAAVGDGRPTGPPGPQGDGDLRRRRVHDELPGTGNGRAARDEPGRADPAATTPTA